MRQALIIEDDENSLLLLSALLRSAGYEAQGARSGAEGLARLGAGPPDFVLLDIGLPDMDGTAVLEEIRRSRIGAGVPVVAVTAHAMAGDRERLMRAGCRGYIEKPINPRTVIAEIERVLRD